MSSNNQPMDGQTNDNNMPTHTKSINTNMPTSIININTPNPTTAQKQPTTQQYNLFPEQQQLYILQQELLKQETILSSFKNDNSPERGTSKEELTTWQQTQVDEMNESINVIKRENEERKQKLFDNSAMGGNSGSSNEKVVLCSAANDHLTTSNNHNSNHNMMSIQQKQFIPEPLKLPSKRHPNSRRGGKVSNNSGRLTQSLNNEQQQHYTSYEQRPYSSFTFGQTPFTYDQHQQQQGYGYEGEYLAAAAGEMNSDTFGRPFSHGGYEMSNPQNMNNLFNGQDYIGMEQYNINDFKSTSYQQQQHNTTNMEEVQQSNIEIKMTRRNSIYKPNQSNNLTSSSLLPNTSNDMVEEVVPTNFFANISKPKKRRLNSNEMLLAMLTDTIVSPGKGGSGDKDKVTLPPPTPNTQGIGAQRGRRESRLSPPTNLDKVKIGDVNTPTMFANYFLSTIGIKECKDDNGGDVINTMPPPPLLVGNNNGNNDVQMKEESKKKKANQIKKKKLPAVVWQPSANTNSPKPTKTIKTTDNNQKPSSYTETPSSETIKSLSNEIKSNLSSSLASSSSSLYQTATNTTTGGDEGSSTASMSRAAQPQFALSMEASQASQQSIHDWDKKFGLRRAHSKTMRESCRSRKRVLDFLKGEGSNLLLLKQQMMERTQHQQGQEDDAVLPSLRASTSSDTALPSLRASTASTSTVSLPLQRGEDATAVIETATDADMNMQDQEVGMSYEVQEEGEALSSLPRKALSGSAISPQSTKKDEQISDSNEILKTHSHSSSKELEQLFRRASLDCSQVITGLARPVQDSDCKSYIAKSA